jgi:hypothetical protein
MSACCNARWLVLALAGSLLIWALAIVIAWALFW